MTVACPVGGERALTDGEKALAAGIFGTAIDLEVVRIKRRRWMPLQPRNVTMCPMGHMHFAPGSAAYCDDFGVASLGSQAHFIHEMTHVWQAQHRGRWWLPLMRHPFCRYDYTVHPGWPLERYGIEQQAEIVAHTFLARAGHPANGSPAAEVLEAIVPF